MTDSLPPWSPLNNPQLAARIQAGLQAAQPFERAHAQRDLYFLERYAWQEYPVKCGRWRSIDDPMALTGGPRYSGPWTKKSWTADLGCVLLLDPSSRQPIATHSVQWWTIERPDRHLIMPVTGATNSLWFAGDPRAGGMFAIAGDGGNAAFGYRFGKDGLKSWDEGPARFEKAAPLLAAQPYDENDFREFGPWLADQPEPPPRPKRFSFLR